jgi:HPt (histidine-containing phosphotransfer) domain-containing protein
MRRPLARGKVSRLDDTYQAEKAGVTIMSAMERIPRAGSDGSKCSSHTVFDYDRSLARLGGDPQLFSEIVSLFLEDSPKLLQRARDSIAGCNMEELERAAHSLKGLSVNFDAVDLASAAAAVEQHAHHRDGQRAQACFQDMERELNRLQSCLNQFHARRSTDDH